MVQVTCNDHALYTEAEEIWKQSAEADKFLQMGTRFFLKFCFDWCSSNGTTPTTQPVMKSNFSVLWAPTLRLETVSVQLEMC